MGGWVRLCAAALLLTAVLPAVFDGAAHAASSLEERKLPMKFSWTADGGSRACEPHCRGWVTATGIVTADTYRAFEEFAAGRDLRGATVVLDSGGGSVLDSIKLGRRWRELRMSTTVGTVVAPPADGAIAARVSIAPDASCESMCVFLLLAGVNRYVPPGAHLRVHQIWMGDRAEDAKAATYSAEDVFIIERDVGRLARYTFEMGGTGDLLEIALSVPPWKPLRELTAVEIRTSNLTSVETLADLLPGVASVPMVSVPKPVQDRYAGEQPKTAEVQKTAEAKAPALTVNTENK
jgi:hypothetical protein